MHETLNQMLKLTLPLTFVIVLAACNRKEVAKPVETTISKTVEFRISPVADYTQPNYSGATAEVKLSVYKQYSNPFSQVVLWDTIITRQPLLNYMSMPNPTVIQKHFTGLNEHDYRVGVSYMIGYISAPPLSANTWSGMGELVPAGDNVLHHVPVHL